MKKEKKKVDPKLVKAIKSGQKIKTTTAKVAAKIQLAQNEKKKRYIASFSKKASEWVEGKLFKLITKAEAEGSDAIFLNAEKLQIPVEALIKAIEKIDGLRIDSRWAESFSDPDGGYYEPGHYDYYVKWKSDPYAGYQY
jgi:predicted secreted protein